MITRVLSSFVLSVLICSPVSSAEKPIDLNSVRAPGNVLISLYVGCMKAKGMSLRESDVEKPQDIGEIVMEFDDWCVAWTVIWFKPMAGYDVELLGQYQLDRFTNVRAMTMESFGKELALMYNRTHIKRTK